MSTVRTPLPIDETLPDALSALRARGALVVEASPGAGKTTRVPPALLGLPDLQGDVVVLEPRRLAARLAAGRVAEELGEAVGGSVGYHVRFERRVSPRTRIHFMTEGVLTQRLVRDPLLRGVGVVVVDEVHERHWQGDVALALVDALRRGPRPELRLVLMSATVDGAALAARYDAAHVCCDPRRFPVAVEHLARPDRDPLDVQVARAVRSLTRGGAGGHVLVFLPGMADIRAAAARCAAVARDEDLRVLPLHGELSSREQDAALAPSTRRKVILATNVAESSVTIDGVTAVVDSGLAKIARTDGGPTTLRVERISRASAEQRAGRAGRTGPGRCLRLYTERELATAPAFDTPEIARVDLCEAWLAVRLATAPDGPALRWLTPPPEAAVESAERLLRDLGALDDRGVTELGRRVAGVPLHPRLGRALLAGVARGVTEEMCAAVAVIAEGGLLRRSGAHAAPARLWAHTERLEGGGGDEVDARRQRAARQARDRLRSHCDRLTRQPAAVVEDAEAALAQALLTGFADRVARRTGGDDGLALAGGGRATLPDKAAVGPQGLCLVLAAGGDRAAASVTLALPLRLDDLLEVHLDEMNEEVSLAMARGRVERTERLSFRGLVVDERVRRAPPGEEATALLASAAYEQLQCSDAFVRFRARCAHAAARSGEALVLDEARVHAALLAIYDGATALDEISVDAAVDLLSAQLDEAARRALATHAPEHVRLASGRELPVGYPPGGEPFAESYLQDFFGSASGPTLGGEALLLELWAPNKRAVQVTRDLAGFWARHYPTLVRQLSRRYPKHHWPDDPISAPPRAPAPRSHRSGDGPASVSGSHTATRSSSWEARWAARRCRDDEEHRSMMLRWLSMLAVASALVASPAAATTRVVDLPDDPESFACQARGPQAVHVRDDAGVDARAFAVDLLRAHARGFFVLGASARAIWVLEAYIPVDACDSVDCVRVALREVRFDGRRITHVLSEGDDAVAPVDRAIGRLGAMAELARLTPVAAETNPRPRLSQGGRSDWVLRIRDSVHRKTYFWRIAQRRVMCWCARQHELSTFVWGA